MRDRLVVDAELLDARYAGHLDGVARIQTRVDSGEFASLADSPWYSDFRLPAWVNRYSAGESIAGLAERFRDIPEVFAKNPNRFFTPAEAGTPLRRLLTVASLVALFEHREGAERVAEIVEAKRVTDFLIDSFIGSLIPFREPSSELQMDIVEQVQGVKKPKEMFTGLKQAADYSLIGEDVLAAQRLKKFVSGEWFVRHRAAFEWSTTNLLAYDGYWCFEGAAVAKVFEINDAALQGHRYYPDDLVRMKGSV